MAHWKATHAGLAKAENEDAVAADVGLGLYGVADGMGGMGAGDLASAAALHELRTLLREDEELIARLANGEAREARQAVTEFLMRSVRETNRIIHEQRQSGPQHGRMGTTLCAALIRGRQALVVNVGDSRAYLLRQGALHLITEDHSLVQEQLRRGMLTEEQAARSPYRNILIRSLGPEALVDPDIIPLELKRGDRLLLCTDGISDKLSDEILQKIMSHVDGAKVVERLIERANQEGGEDNATALLVELDEDSDKPVPSPFKVDPDAKIRVLWQLPMFHHLEYAELVKLMSVATTRVYDAGEVVLREHEPGGTFLVIIEGCMTVERGGQILSELSSGDQVGELALLDGAPRSATVLAKEPSSALSITSSEFYDLIRREPVMATKLLWRIGVQMAQRIRELNGEVARHRSGKG